MVSRSSHARLNHSLLLVTQSKKLVEVHAFQWIFKIFVHSIMHTYTSDLSQYWYVLVYIEGYSFHQPSHARLNQGLWVQSVTHH